MIKKITVAACVIAISGCVSPYSEAPIAKNFPTTSQEKLQAASHWGLITNDLSKRIQVKVDGKIDKKQPLYISSKNSAPFNQAVVAELISSLVADGYLVVKNPENTIKVDVDTQVLSFSPNRLQASASGVPTAIVAGLWTLSEAGVAITAAGVASGAIVAKDLDNYFGSEVASGSTPKTELIINVSVSDANHYIAVSRATYYVSDTDKWLYQAAQVSTFNVRGD